MLSTATRESVTLAVVTAEDAALGASDPTRRQALMGADGVRRFPGLTRPEAERAATVLADVPAGELGGVLLPVQLDVVLSDGAGPYLLDADGILALRLGDHPAIAGTGVVMGQVSPRMVVIGAAVDGGDGTHRWRVRRLVDHDRRVEALDDLAGCADSDELVAWCTLADVSPADGVR